MDNASLAGDVHSIDTYSEITKIRFLALIIIQNKFDFEKKTDFITININTFMRVHHQEMIDLY